MTTKFIENLKQFNIKERFNLLSNVLSREIDALRLAEKFVENLKNIKDITIPELPEPKEIYVALDYHLDWLYASLFLVKNSIDDKPFKNNGQIKRNTQDIDLLLAYPDTQNHKLTNLILIEAKAYSPWKNSQIQAKLNRLRRIFNEYQDDVNPLFIFCSPKEPKRLKTDDFPEWAKDENGKFYHLRFEIPDFLKKIYRCDDKGRNNEHGEYWTIRDITL